MILFLCLLIGNWPREAGSIRVTYRAHSRYIDNTTNVSRMKTLNRGRGRPAAERLTKHNHEQKYDQLHVPRLATHRQHNPAYTRKHTDTLTEGGRSQLLPYIYATSNIQSKARAKGVPLSAHQVQDPTQAQRLPKRPAAVHAHTNSDFQPDYLANLVSVSPGKPGCICTPSMTQPLRRHRYHLHACL